MNKTMLMIFGMTAVTYLPRLIPFLLASRLQFPDRLRSFLRFIPYATLGALIIPGVFTATPQMPIAAMAGAGFALVYGWYKGGIIVPVLGAVLTTYLVLSI